MEACAVRVSPFSESLLSVGPHSNVFHASLEENIGANTVFLAFFPLARINVLIKEPESSLLAGLLLGAKNSLGTDWQEKFRQVGVSHIVALSGYNVTIVALGIMMFLSFLQCIFYICIEKQ